MTVTRGETADFQHGPLGQTQSSIRLIEILPDLQQGPIRCELIHSVISDSYVCLSYMWGDGNRTRNILVNGKRFRVYTNLFNFLHLMQAQPVSHVTSASPHTRIRYWVDALFIDQSNNSERNHQVAQMGRILLSAQLVHVWLGNLPSAAHIRYISSGSLNHMTLTDWLSAPYPYNYFMARHIFRN
ncbi:heterokaryon incompatibility protein-domain-containing protein [Paraphoma chrysanthemicola]|uniref:Heterokaryon incompatibility protein-domain-containing protein n=1 Tax=Paraphoma chrysanthemicola TaxID=798071 RepID=A0A8K0W2Z8_9PLEO|nr:heterokaryon incompatibility protein-domain-containing protein [Paraphoma chrysanthemicola]